MRTIRYYIVNKTTKNAVYTNCSRVKCETRLNGMEDKENYAIAYKWLSI